MFRHQARTWIEEAVLRGSDIAAGDWFGAAVAVQGNLIAVGAPHGRSMGPGAAYVFAFDGSQWTEQAKLAPEQGRTDDLGVNVRFACDRLFVACSRCSSTGAVTVYSLTSPPSLEQRFRPDDERAVSFGSSLDCGDSLLAVGSPSYGFQSGQGSVGAIFAFDRTSTDWTSLATLHPPDSMSPQSFGYRIAVDGDDVFVGDPVGDAQVLGRVFQFTRGATGFSSREIVRMDVGDTDQFGWYQAADAGKVLIGSPSRNLGAANSGVVYAYAREPSP